MKYFSFANPKEENLAFSRNITDALWLYLSAMIVIDLLFRKEPVNTLNTILIIFSASLVFFILSSFFKVKQTVYFNLRILKLVSHIDLDKCLFNIKRIAILEELLKVNFINIAILILMTTNNALLYRNTHLNILILLIAFAVQMLCYSRLDRLRKIQATLYFPEVHNAYQIKLEEQEKLVESERHLPWFKRTF